MSARVKIQLLFLALADIDLALITLLCYLMITAT